MLSEKLKTETLTNHQQLEKMLVTRMKSIRSVQDYIDLLQLFYSYFGALETRINTFISAEQLPDYTHRRKSAALSKDISDLGGTPVETVSGDSLPEIENALQAFGALYVIEGSTLGGKIIAKMMAQQLGITNGTGLSFFNGYGDDSAQMWDKFKQKLDLIAQDSNSENIVIEAANQTFTKFKLQAGHSTV
ncbi:biliverdin-producing heme oxygenase [Mucilaginibacter terrae]|uniref:Heme oxygenase n=1 Tax=Mucilaginibacter terrae TaxID=1955052 RepID=A0ABU3GUK6_9SPHI|nr:biliverdin-producing heme oxygenase [Mucilaginibacter terrae]MDT3403454.1 heme oxygenase [Mucilaginibacter terrae]